MRNRIGREIRATRSIPLCTPKYTTPTVAAMKSPERRNWRPPFPITATKRSPVCSPGGKPPRLHPMVLTK